MLYNIPWQKHEITQGVKLLSERTPKSHIQFAYDRCDILGWWSYLEAANIEGQHSTSDLPCRLIPLLSSCLVETARLFAKCFMCKTFMCELFVDMHKRWFHLGEIAAGLSGRQARWCCFPLANLLFFLLPSISSHHIHKWAFRWSISPAPTLSEVRTLLHLQCYLVFW